MTQPLPDEPEAGATIAPNSAFLSDLSVVRGLNAAAIVVAALYLGRQLLVPLALSALLAFVLAPVCAAMQRMRLPRALAVLLCVPLAFLVIGGLGAIVAAQGGQLAVRWPDYQATLEAKWAALRAASGPIGQVARGVQAGLVGGGMAGSSGTGIDRTTGLALARSIAEPLLGPLATAGVVLVFVIFILLYSEDLRDRLVRLVGRRDLHRTILAMNEAARRLSRYFLYQLMLNGLFGALIAASLAVAGLPNPLLWGMLAALMRFVPFIGTVLALVPPLVLAIAAVPGWSLAIEVFALFACVEIVMSQAVEPLLYSHSTGLSPIAVILAAAFWAFLWGPIGLLLATPLTVCLVVIGRHVAPLAFLDVMLGDGSPLDPPETFYQRALEGKSQVLLASSRRWIARHSPVDFYDHVALPGLALAQSDMARDVLAFDRLEAIHHGIETLLASLGPPVPAAPPPSIAPAREAGPIVCLPGRGQLDDLAAGMAMQVLAEAGFDVRIESNVRLGAAGAGDASDRPLGDTRFCCLSVLEQGSSIAGLRYFVRRIRRAMPDAVIVIGLWHAALGSRLLSALRREGQDLHIVLSIGELVALVQALQADPGATAIPTATATVPADRDATETTA